MKLEQAERLFLGNYPNLRTRRNVQESTTKLVDWLGAGRPLSLITPTDLHLYIQELQERTELFTDHPTIPARKGRLSVATIDKHIRVIKSFFNFLVKLEVLEKSPAKSLKQQGRRYKSVERSKAVTEEEIALIQAVAFGDVLKDALVSFIADTGCRAGGVSGLKISDLDLTNLSAVVTEKGDKTRPVWYSEATAHKLRVWISRRSHFNHEFVFGTERGPRTAPAISQIIRRLAVKAGIKRPIGTHSFRHAAAYRLSDNGVSPTIAAAALGHDNPQTTIDFYYPNDYNRAEKAIRDMHTHRYQDKHTLRLPDPTEDKTDKDTPDI